MVLSGKSDRSADMIEVLMNHVIRIFIIIIIFRTFLTTYFVF
jgi:hypothetical protein